MLVEILFRFVVGRPWLVMRLRFVVLLFGLLVLWPMIGGFGRRAVIDMRPFLSPYLLWLSMMMMAPSPSCSISFVNKRIEGLGSSFAPHNRSSSVLLALSGSTSVLCHVWGQNVFFLLIIIVFIITVLLMVIIGKHGLHIFV